MKHFMDATMTRKVNLDKNLARNCDESDVPRVPLCRIIVSDEGKETDESVEVGDQETGYQQTIASPEAKKVGLESPAISLLTSDIPFSRSASEIAKYDWMQIHITIYGLSGIIRTMEEDKPKKNFLSCKLRKKKSTNSSFADTKGTTTVDTSFDAIEAYHQQLSVPTTAIVSCPRNAAGSKTQMETFLPSLPISATSSLRSDSVRYMANWRVDNEESNDHSLDKLEASTFKMVRAMKHEAYHPEKNLLHASNYMHETIDLNVFVGRGTELIPLGTAAIAISGDEEGEVIMNIPTRPVIVVDHDEYISPRSLSRRKKKVKNQRLRNKLYFSQDPKNYFSLADNAILRVGVRVLPQQTVEEASKKGYPRCGTRSTVSSPNDHSKKDSWRCGTRSTISSTNDELEELLKGMVDENLLLEAEEEDFLESIRRRTLETLSEGDEEEGIFSRTNTYGESTFGRSAFERSRTQQHDGFFCNAFSMNQQQPLFSSQSNRMPDVLSPKSLKESLTGKEIPLAMPMKPEKVFVSFISSVSESLSDDFDEEHEQHRASF